MATIPEVVEANYAILQVRCSKAKLRHLSRVDASEPGTSEIHFQALVLLHRRCPGTPEYA